MVNVAQAPNKALCPPGHDDPNPDWATVGGFVRTSQVRCKSSSWTGQQLTMIITIIIINNHSVSNERTLPLVPGFRMSDWLPLTRSRDVSCFIYLFIL